MTMPFLAADSSDDRKLDWLVAAVRELLERDAVVRDAVLAEREACAAVGLALTADESGCCRETAEEIARRHPEPPVTDAAALLAAVLAAPDDDGPRLVYADWLDEHGEGERAELIRVQVELADYERRLGIRNEVRTEPFVHAVVRPTGERETLLCQRERELLDTARNLFPPFVRVMIPTGPHGSHVGPDGVERPAFGRRMRFGMPLGGSFIFGEPSRGFIGQIECSAADWLAHADAILAAHPVTAVTVTGVRLTRDADSRWRFEGDPTGWESEPYGPLIVLSDDRLAMNRQAIEQVCRLRWPSVKTWHLPPEPVTLQARRLTMLAHVPNELLEDNAMGGGPVEAEGEWTAYDEARALFGVPAAPVPAGVIEVDDPAHNPAPDRPRRNSRMPDWLTAQRGRRPR